MYELRSCSLWCAAAAAAGVVLAAACCRYAKEDGDMESLERDLNEETGWKLVHGDVFRPPAHRMLLAAAVGTGIQLVMLGLFVIPLTILGTFYEVRKGVNAPGWVHVSCGAVQAGCLVTGGACCGLHRLRM
jgi:transmembrane 9 superfamily protein 3